MKLHEILAVEGDNEAVARKVMTEAVVTFTKRAQHFNGFERTLEMFEDTGEDLSVHTERQALTTTVPDKLEYMCRSVARYWDTVYRKDVANQTAKADIIIGDKVLASGVPSTFLLGLETKLKKLREVIETVPTLAPNIEWEKAPEQGPNVYHQKYPEKRTKTTKAIKSKVLYEATEHHPAQIDKWDETVNVGVFTREVWSGMITPAEKSAMLERVDTLAKAVKQARQRANCEPVTANKIAEDVLDYVLYE